jgi:hypothetical protein
MTPGSLREVTMSEKTCDTCSSGPCSAKERRQDEAVDASLGSIPIDARVVEASDAGRPCVDELAGTGAAAAFECAIRPILDFDDEVEELGPHRTDLNQKGEDVCA